MKYFAATIEIRDDGHEYDFPAITEAESIEEATENF